MLYHMMILGFKLNIGLGLHLLIVIFQIFTTNVRNILVSMTPTPEQTLITDT